MCLISVLIISLCKFVSKSVSEIIKIYILVYLISLTYEKEKRLKKVFKQKKKNIILSEWSARNNLVSKYKITVFVFDEKCGHKTQEKL